MTGDTLISACWIVKNEALYLKSSIKSVLGLVDELLVCDTGSDDDSILIAREAGARVLSIPWTGDYSEARNRAISEAKAPWILFLDGDEALESSHHSLLRELVTKPSSDAYYLNRRHYVPNRCSNGLLPPSEPFPPIELNYVGYLQTHDVRLFKSNLKYRYTGAVHESIEASLWESGVQIVRSSAIIHHFGPCKPQEEGRKKGERYISLAASKYLRNKSDWKALLDYGVELYQGGRGVEAISLFSEGIDRFPEEWDLQLEYGVLLAEYGDFYSAIEVLEKVIEARPGLHRAWLALGILFLELGDYSTAIVSFNQCQLLIPEEGLSLIKLGVAYLMQDNIPSASSCFHRAKVLFPRLSDPVIGLNLCGMIETGVTMSASRVSTDDGVRLCGQTTWRELMERLARVRA